MDCYQMLNEFISFGLAVRSIEGGVGSRINTPAFQKFQTETITPIFKPEFKEKEAKEFVEKGENWVENWLVAMFPIVADAAEPVRESFLRPYKAAIPEVEDDGEGNIMFDSQNLSELILRKSLDAFFNCVQGPATMPTKGKRFFNRKRQMNNETTCRKCFESYKPA